MKKKQTTLWKLLNEFLKFVSPHDFHPSNRDKFFTNRNGGNFHAIHFSMCSRLVVWHPADVGQRSSLIDPLHSVSASFSPAEVDLWQFACQKPHRRPAAAGVCFYALIWSDLKTRKLFYAMNIASKLLSYHFYRLFFLSSISTSVWWRFSFEIYEGNIRKVT